MVETRSDGVATDLAKGALAGVVATATMVSTRDLMYARESEETRAREAQVRGSEQMTPLQRPIRRAAERLGRPLPKEQEQRVGNAAAWGLGIAGVTAYAALRGRVRGVDAAGGLAFGAAAWLLEDELMMHGLGLTPPAREYPWQAHARGLVSHLAYGVAAEAALRAMDGVTARTGRDGGGATREEPRMDAAPELAPAPG